MTAALAATMVGVVVLPHLLDLRVAPPPAAIALWLSSLLMRALLVLAAVLALVLIVPQTAVFAAITHWCWHTVLPILATHLGLDGHRLGDAAVVVPAVGLSVSLLWAAAGLVRAARAVGTFVRRARLAAGPDDSVIIGGADVVVAAAGLRRPRVLVSAGALACLDDEELAASLAHERGHIARGHRWVLLAAELARSFGRVIPGTRTAVRQLSFHVERDADRWALRRRHDPLALASAICKAAVGGLAPGFALNSLGGDGAGLIERRVDELTGEPRRDCARRRRGFAAVAVCSAALTLVALTLVPAATAAGISAAGEAPPVERHCES